MSKMTHELILVDRGMPTKRVALRTSCPEPPATLGGMCDIAHHESALPADISETLLSVMTYHEDALAIAIGKRWTDKEWGPWTDANFSQD